ncbi:hypothetical protein AAG906_039118 [Vitis piasezkii]
MALPGEKEKFEEEKFKKELLNHAMKGNWGLFVAMYKQYPWVRIAKLTRSGETALHIAVCQSTEDTVKRLVNLVDAEEEKAQHGESSSAAEAKNPLMIANDRGNTPLHLAALIGNVNMCNYIATKREELVGLRNIAGETPLFLAALRGKKEAFLYLHSKCGPVGTHNHYVRRDGQTILHVAISGEYFDVAYHIICKYDHLIFRVDENGYTPLHVLASKPAVFKTSLHLGPLSRFIYKCLHVEKLTNEPVPVDYKGKMKPDEKYPENYKTLTRRENSPTSQKHMQANDANYCEDPEERYDDTRENQVRLIVWVFGSRDKRKKMLAKKEKNIWSVQIMDLMLRKSSHYNYDRRRDRGRRPDFPDYLREEIDEGREITPLLLAAKNGITEMVMGILEIFPATILDMDSADKNIVHLAVENRRTKLYEKLAKNISIYDSAFRAVDDRGNSVLHLAATLGDHRPFPSATLQMQWEIKWYKYVKNSMPRDLCMIFNNEHRTAKEMFRESHKVLVKEGNESLISTSNSCSLVATVVTTVAFATIATIPGGMKEDSSTPNLEHDPGFIVFAISSLIALSFSITSVIAFLAILTPRHSPKDFERQLPKSSSAMLVSFCAGHFFLVRDDFHHNAFLMYGVVCLPVAYFAMKQFPFYVDHVLHAFTTAPRHMPI